MHACGDACGYCTLRIKPFHHPRQGRRTNSSTRTHCSHIFGWIPMQSWSPASALYRSVAKFDCGPRWTCQFCFKTSQYSQMFAKNKPQKPGLWFHAELLRMSSLKSCSTKGSSSCHSLNCCKINWRWDLAVAGLNTICLPLFTANPQTLWTRPRATHCSFCSHCF